MKKKWTKSKIFQQAYKFVLVGILNTALDVLVLNILIFATNTGRNGFYYSVYKTVGFIVALVNSYFLNKYWTFASAKQKRAAEFGQFVVISLASLFVNVITSSYMVNNFQAPPGLIQYWPSIAAIVGTAASFILNFLGYKFLVFKKEDGELMPPA